MSYYLSVFIMQTKFRNIMVRCTFPILVLGIKIFLEFPRKNVIP